jgi:fatty acid desaturase
MSDNINELEPAETTCIDRTRMAVLNVLVFVGASIAISGGILGRLDRGGLLWDPVRTWRISIIVLFAIFAGSHLIKRVGSGRAMLQDPASRARRFSRMHVLSAVVGGLAVPLGFFFGWAIQPNIEKIAPFWVVALASGFLALPRGHEITGFDEPMAECEPQKQGKAA